MNNKKKDYFEVHCNINHGQELVLKLPYTVHADFTRTMSAGDEKLMARIIELFSEFELLDQIKRDTLQALIFERESELSTIEDLLVCLKAVRLCTVFLDKND